MKKLFILLTLLLCVGCAKKNNSDIIKFEFSLSAGLGGGCEYTIEAKNEKTIYSKKCYGIEHDEFEKEIDNKHLKEINKIINEKKIYKWDGFDRSDKGVMDGSGFSLSVLYSDGKSISAHGYMKYPSNYKAGKQALLNYLAKLD